MFGTFRLALAVCVVLSHMGVQPHGILPGVSAVTCFFMVSGYSMSALLQRSYPKVPEDVFHFYASRFWRLAPQYYFYLIICAFTVIELGWRETGAQTGSPGVINILANLTIIPLSFWMLDTPIKHFLLNMPTWSLGLEMSFYLLLPWLLMNRSFTWIAAGLGAVTWWLATHGVLDPDFYGYRLLPGTLVFFLVGAAVQRRDWYLFGMLGGFFALCAISLFHSDQLSLSLNLSLLVGAAVGCVAVPLLAQLRRRKLDDYLGHVSYGCFLAHWIFVTALKSHYGELWAVTLAVCGSIACGWISLTLIEMPAHQLRKVVVQRRRGQAIHV
jgi:peptidoglycan/LPS O-acetylase OafA/YrhL